MDASSQRLYHHFHKAAQLLKKAADQQLLQASGITTAQAAVLAVVAQQAEASQRSIANALHLNESAITAMVDRLMKLGLLSRRRSEQDGRVWQLQLTASGRDKTRQASTAFRAINRRIEAVLSDDQRDSLATSLHNLIEAFSANGTAPD